MFDKLEDKNGATTGSRLDVIVPIPIPAGEGPDPLCYKALFFALSLKWQESQQEPNHAPPPADRERKPRHTRI
jgi:hypothetical protein